MQPHDSRRGEPPSIREALDRGMTDEAIVALIVKHLRVDETTARQSLAMEKGEPRENWDDVIDVTDDPAFPQPKRPGQS